MRRNLCLVLLLILCFAFSGCTQTQQSDLQTETYLLPNSYFEFTGSDIEEAVESCLALGKEFCTDAKVTNEGMQLVLTKTQLENLVKRNDDFIAELEEGFMNANDLYRCELDESYKNLTLYFDENISSTMQVKTILGIASNYGMNYMLQNNTTDWNVKIEIYNCHTDKLVVSVNVPDEEISYGAKEWEESYND